MRFYGVITVNDTDVTVYPTYAQWVLDIQHFNYCTWYSKQLFKFFSFQGMFRARPKITHRSASVWPLPGCQRASRPQFRARARPQLLRNRPLPLPVWRGRWASGSERCTACSSWSSSTAARMTPRRRVPTRVSRRRLLVRQTRATRSCCPIGSRRPETTTTTTTTVMTPTMAIRCHNLSS